MESKEPFSTDPILSGLRSLLENEFPKTCPMCGRQYASLESFLLQTKGVSAGSGMMDYAVDASTPKLTVCRNCVCGSTLAAFCEDRRDTSPVGRRRRIRFDKLLELFKSRGISEDVARGELRAFLRGESI